METITIAGVLRTVAWGGSTALVVGLLSKFGDRWPWFQAQGSWTKRSVMYGISAALSLIAWALLKYVPDSTWMALQEPFAILVTVLGGILGNQAVYYVKNKLNPTVANVERIEDAGMIVPAGMIVATKGVSIGTATLQPEPPPGEEVG